jgi:hypothetical protein
VWEFLEFWRFQFHSYVLSKRYIVVVVVNVFRLFYKGIVQDKAERLKESLFLHEQRYLVLSTSFGFEKRVKKVSSSLLILSSASPYWPI